VKWEYWKDSEMATEWGYERMLLQPSLIRGRVKRVSHKFIWLTNKGKGRSTEKKDRERKNWKGNKVSTRPVKDNCINEIHEDHCLWQEKKLPCGLKGVREKTRNPLRKKRREDGKTIPLPKGVKGRLEAKMSLDRGETLVCGKGQAKKIRTVGTG